MKINENAALFLVAAVVMAGWGAWQLLDTAWGLIAASALLFLAALSVDVDRGE